MVTLFAIASGLQAHRNDGNHKNQLHPGFPLGNILNPENVKSRYTEGLIRAIYLRLVRRGEWGQITGAQTRDCLLHEIARPNQMIISGELLFALARSALPPITRKTFIGFFSHFLNGDCDKIAEILISP